MVSSEYKYWVHSFSDTPAGEHEYIKPFMAYVDAISYANQEVDDDDNYRVYVRDKYGKCEYFLNS